MSVLFLQQRHFAAESLDSQAALEKHLQKIQKADSEVNAEFCLFSNRLYREDMKMINHVVKKPYYPRFAFLEVSDLYVLW